ncbi:unnamed protein product, partial [Discosporangium mesarthrocarpum]
DAQNTAHLRGKVVKKTYVAETWLQGRHKPTTAGCVGEEEMDLWSLNKLERLLMWDKWETAIRQDRATEISKLMVRLDGLVQEMEGLQLQRDSERVVSARVVGCTTTGAAIHHEVLREAGCQVLLVEEAAEVLEAHILTAMGPSVKHLLMIGE